MLYLLILIIPLVVYIIFGAMILFHLKRYSISGDLTQRLTTILIITSIILGAFVTVAFFNIPWNELNLNDIVKDFFIPSFNQPTY